MSKSKANDPTDESRDTAERSSGEALEIFNAAAGEATKAMQDSCKTAVKGMQHYSGKVMQFTQANIKSQVEFVQKLANAKSPAEFIEMSTSYTRQQLEILVAQGKELTALAQQVTRDAAGPLKGGIVKIR